MPALSSLPLSSYIGHETVGHPHVDHRYLFQVFDEKPVEEQVRIAEILGYTVEEFKAKIRYGCCFIDLRKANWFKGVDQ